MIIIWCGKGFQKVKFKHRKGRATYRYARWKVLGYEDGRFCSKYISGRLEALMLRGQVVKLKGYKCKTCGLRYKSNKERCPDCEAKGQDV